jgi:diguanylate cyclase (GGDEF)-like protein
MTITDAVRLSELPAQGTLSLWDLSSPVWVVPPTLTCGQLDARFRGHGGAEHSSVVVHDTDDGRFGSVQRSRFERAMSGPFGFGRALLARRAVTTVTHFGEPALARTATLGDALSAIFERPEERRYDDLVLRGRDGWRRLPVTVVLESAASRMAWHASRDGLTGLANRSAFFSHLENLVRSSAGSDDAVRTRLGVVFVDLDRLKAVNDTLGHNAGDALIRSVAQRLRAAARPQDVVARLGGDEFAVACRLTDVDDSAAARVLESLATRHLEAVRALDPALDPRARSTASIGAALSVPLTEPVGADTLLREADLAMYGAKQSGGDRVATVLGVGDGSHDDVARNGSLARALERGELVLHFQPIVDAATGALLSAEALVRWEHPVVGLLGADRVLRAAREEELEVVLDRWVLSAALRQHTRWHGVPDAPALVNVNVSPTTLATDGFADLVLEALRESGCGPSELRLELPETASLSAVRAAAPQLQRLAEEGVALVIDDMGAGASSLRHLSAFPVSGLKIDRSFVAGMLVRDSDRAVVQLLSNLGVGLGLRVTAEGVETGEQAEELRALGVNALQGYHIARPCPAEEMLTPCTS